MLQDMRSASASCTSHVLEVSGKFQGRRDQVAIARRFVDGALSRCPASADAVLLTSELATNAVVHTATGDGGSFSVAIRHGEAMVRVEVTDGGSDTVPLVNADGKRDVSSRGLFLVSTIAKRWGYEGDSSARVVWFELDCR